MLGDQGLGDDLGGRHALALGHRGAPFVDRLGRQPTSLGPAVAGPRPARPGAVTPLLPTRPMTLWPKLSGPAKRRIRTGEEFAGYAPK